MSAVHRVGAAAMGGTLLAWMLMLNACAPVLLGAAALGGVAASYSQGSVVETYDVDYRHAVTAASDTLSELKIPVSRTVGDELKTTITAVRPDQTPVSVEVVRLTAGQAQVEIRTGPVGVMELDTSRRIQEQIRERLARKPARDTRAPETAALRFPPNDPGRAGAADGATRKPVAAAARPGKAPALIIYFDHGSNELRESEHPKLDRLAAALIARSEVNVTLNGYADVTGAPDYNRIVSESRASTVKMYLVGKGIEAQRIRVIGHGARDFAAANSGEGFQLNRRVEIAYDSP